MVFTHGSNVNFQESAREMFLSDLESLLNQYLQASEKLLLGTINLERQELHQYGYVESFDIDQEQMRFRCVFTPFESSKVREVAHSLTDLQISHEAKFDVIDHKLGKLFYQVAYVTFEDHQGDELTYFFADGKRVENPLMYVASFWEKVSEVGRDVDFSMTGCQAHDLAKKLKRK